MFGSPALRYIPAVVTAGNYLNAGLPNIQGTVAQNYNSSTASIGWHNKGNNGWGTGALYLSGTSLSSPRVEGYGTGGHMVFDASKSNSIYGKSSTVQPPTLTARYYIKY